MLVKVSLFSSAHLIAVDGLFHQVNVFGVMPSAHPSTGASNTFMRIGELFSVLRRNIVGVGDDVIYQGRITPEEKAELLLRGVRIHKEFTTADDGVDGRFDFNSHFIYRPGLGAKYIGVFQNTTKLIAGLLLKHAQLSDDGDWTPTVAGREAVAGGKHVLRNTPEWLSVYTKISEEIGYSGVQAEYRESFFNDLF